MCASLRAAGACSGLTRVKGRSGSEHRSTARGRAGGTDGETLRSHLPDRGEKQYHGYIQVSAAQSQEYQLLKHKIARGRYSINPW